MNRIAKITLLLLVPLVAYNQKQQNKCWIPQKYVDSVVINGSKNKYNSYLKPIQSILLENEKYYIQTFRGMYQPININLTSAKIPIDELAMNLKYFSKIEQDSINNFKYYINQYDDSLVLEEYNDSGTINYIKFINELNGYKFIDLRETTRRLLFQGQFELYGNNHEKVALLEITLSGDIIGSSEWVSYNYVRVLTPDEKNNFYDLVEFRSKKGEVIKKLAFSYNENEKIWVGYEYKTMKDKYRIQISPEYVLMMKKI